MNDMTKTERNKTINKLVYKFAESLGYEVDNSDNDIMFVSDTGKIDDDIQYRRSCHTVAAVNWASEKTLNDEKAIDIYIAKILKFSDDELINELG
jgi:hypothetical protein